MIEVGTNSYVTLAEANEYFDTKVHCDSWVSADDATKEKALLEATRDIDMYRFKGYKVDADQELQFPRVNIGRQPTEVERLVYSSTIKVLPKEVKYAQMEQAYYILSGRDEADDLRSKGVSSFSAGGASMSFTDTGYNLLAPLVKQMLMPYLSRTGVIV